MKITPPIYVIGDSHVRNLVKYAPDIFKSSQAEDVNVFDSKSAYAVGTDGHEWYLNEALERLPDGANVILSFGEIDCREYIPRLAQEKNISIPEMVNEVLGRYLSNCVEKLSRKFNVIIMGVYLCPDDFKDINKAGDILRAKGLYNASLKKYCTKTLIPFINLYNGYNVKNYSDSTHMGECIIPLILEQLNLKYEYAK